MVTPELLLRDGSDTTEEGLPDPCPSSPAPAPSCGQAGLLCVSIGSAPLHQALSLKPSLWSLPFPLPWAPLKAEARSQFFRCRSSRAQRCSTPVPDESSYICPPQPPQPAEARGARVRRTPETAVYTPQFPPPPCGPFISASGPFACAPAACPGPLCTAPLHRTPARPEPPGLQSGSRGLWHGLPQGKVIAFRSAASAIGQASRSLPQTLINGQEQLRRISLQAARQ